MPSIYIFVEPPYVPEISLAFSLGKHWRREGIRVTVGPLKTLDADVGIINIDRTRIAPESLPANPHGRPLLNARVLDISKRLVSTQLLTVETRYDGRVIVKTNTNYRGIPERQALLKGRPLVGSPRRFYAGYELFDRPSKVPEWVWSREDLVVERFLPEMDNGSYILRSWVFFGDQDYNVRMTSPEPIVKLANIVSHEFTDEVPEVLRQTRTQMGFDFGKFDYVIVDGETILFDVNKTPSIAYAPDNPRQVRLAQAIHAYLPRIV